MDKLEQVLELNWLNFQNLFIERLLVREGKGRPNPSTTSVTPLPSQKIIGPEIEISRNYHETLLNASKSMIRFKSPEHLIKMIGRLIDKEVKVEHTGILMYKEEKNSYVLIDSKGEVGKKLPVGFIRFTVDSALISMFEEGKNFLLSNSGAVIYDDLKLALENINIITNDAGFRSLLEGVRKEMDMVKAAICVPCYFKRRLLGVLILGRKLSVEKFTKDEMHLFVTLANDVAMAITNSQLIKSLQKRVKEVEESFSREHRLFIQTAIALATAIDARDSYTQGHSERVTSFSMSILDEISYLPEIAKDRKFRENLHITSLLHDVGKIGIPDNILRKKGPLTFEERIEVSKHPIIGTTILFPIKELCPSIIKAVRNHQEWFNGEGYPDRLKGSDIPLLSRIIGVADAFDAMTSDRPYRPRLKLDIAVAELKKCSGTQFDPEIVTGFLRAYKKKSFLLQLD